MKRFSIFVTLVAVLALLTSSVSPPVSAHWDIPGGSSDPIQVACYLYSVQVPDEDDGLNGESEFLLEVECKQEGHDDGRKQVLFSGQLDLDGLPQYHWELKEWIYNHYECTPRSALSCHFKMTEVDSTNLDKVMAAVIASGVTVSVATAGVGTVVSVAVGAVVTVVGLVASLNGDDDLGGETIYVSDGQQRPRIRGEDGWHEPFFEGVTQDMDLDPNPCENPNPTPLPTPVPDPEQQAEEDAEETFGPLEEGYNKAGEVSPEEGNPSELTESKVGRLRDTLSNMVDAVARAQAAQAIYNARAFGVEGAIGSYYEAESAAPGGRLGLYREAFRTARWRLYQGDEEEPIPFTDLFLIPGDSLSVRRLPVSVGVAAVGMEDAPTVTSELSTALEQQGEFYYDLVLDAPEGDAEALSLATAPVTYTVDISGGGGWLTDTLTLVVEPDPKTYAVYLPLVMRD